MTILNKCFRSLHIQFPIIYSTHPRYSVPHTTYSVPHTTYHIFPQISPRAIRLKFPETRGWAYSLDRKVHCIENWDLVKHGGESYCEHGLIWGQIQYYIYNITSTSTTHHRCHDIFCERFPWFWSLFCPNKQHARSTLLSYTVAGDILVATLNLITFHKLSQALSQCMSVNTFE